MASFACNFAVGFFVGYGVIRLTHDVAAWLRQGPSK